MKKFRVVIVDGITKRMVLMFLTIAIIQAFSGIKEQMQNKKQSWQEHQGITLLLRL